MIALPEWVAPRRRMVAAGAARCRIVEDQQTGAVRRVRVHVLDHRGGRVISYTLLPAPSSAEVGS